MELEIKEVGPLEADGETACVQYVVDGQACHHRVRRSRLLQKAKQCRKWATDGMHADAEALEAMAERWEKIAEALPTAKSKTGRRK